jgi:hypothetical protein
MVCLMYEIDVDGKDCGGKSAQSVRGFMGDRITRILGGNVGSVGYKMDAPVEVYQSYRVPGAERRQDAIS